MKKREDCFFGLHFDKHATSETKDIGITYPVENLERLCKEIKPDYIQTDAKGFEGLSCYPTKVGNQAPQIKGDVLRIWREVTKKYDIPLYVHFCGVVDKESSRKHPDWSEKELDEKNATFFGKGSMSIFGPYANELLIPQLKEIAGVYKADGAWIDAEAIYTGVDVCDKAKEEYKKKYKKEIPENTNAENYGEYLEFLRDSFNEYVNYYVGEVKKEYPVFQICSNMSMGSSTPDSKVYDTDFISVDYAGETAIDSARYETRLMANRGKPWDCMAWDYRSSAGHANGYSDFKTKVQLCQEAATVISAGGGFQIYHHMGFYKPFVFENYALNVFKSVSEFCRAREKYCFKAKLVPDVGIVFSTKNYYGLKKKTFERGETNFETIMMGAINGILNNGRSAEFILTHQATNLKDYAVLVLPDTELLEQDLKEKLTEYVKNGGTLFLAGSHSIKNFKEELSLKTIKDGCGTINNSYSIETIDGVADIHGSYVEVETENIQPLCYVTKGEYTKRPEKIVCLFGKNYGGGRFVAGTFDVFFNYEKSRNSILRKLIDNAITSENGKVKIEGTKYVETVLTEKDGLRMLNLINISGEHRDLAVGNFDEILPIYSIKVQFVCPYKPKKLKAYPENNEISFDYIDGRVCFTLDKLEIHTVIVAEK